MSDSSGAKHPPADGRQLEIEKIIAQRGLLKVPDLERTGDGDSKYRRVAKFLFLIGAEKAAQVVALLPEEQVRKVLPEIVTIQSVPAEEAASIMAEFSSLLETAKAQGGVTLARDILRRAYGSVKADRVLANSVPFPDGKPFEYLESENPRKILLALKDESDYVRALVVSHLPGALAAKVIAGLDEAARTETLLRLAKMEKLPPETIRRIDAAFKEKVGGIQLEEESPLDGQGALTAILKNMSVEGGEAVLRKLSETDPELSSSLKKNLFTLDDVIRVDGRLLEERLRAMDDRTIALLIAGKPTPFRMKVLSNLSKGRGDRVLEEESLGKPFKKADVSRVTNGFLARLREDAGDVFF